MSRQTVLRTEVLPALAYTVIHEAKSSGLLPEALMSIAQSLVTGASEGAADYAVLVTAAVKQLKKDKRFFLQSAGAAQKAVDYVLHQP